MSGPQAGFLTTYNSLTDKHLAGYFSNRRIRRHLQRSGLISKSGRIIPEKEYRLNAMRKDHQKYVQECLAQAIFHKVLDMERHHQLEIKRRLENFVRKERVQKIKVEQSRRSVKDANLVLSPHPPLGPRSHYGLLPLVTGEQARHSQLRAQGPLVDLNPGRPYHHHQQKESVFLGMTAASRPNTAPGNLQGPRQHQPLGSAAAVQNISDLKRRSPTLDNDQQFASGGEKSQLRLMNSVEYVTGMSPYRLPIINNYVIPVPPPPLQAGGRSVKTGRNGMPRRRRFCPTTAPNDLEQLLTKNSGKFHRPSLRSNALVTMIFLGKGVCLSHDDVDFRDEIKVYQQHCGGENLCVYKGKLLEGETFQFISRRHHGFSFSLTFFLNGMQVDRLSSCCEYKHQKHSRLGGRHGYFGFLNVERASPCYRCIIAMGLDKKPSPPKKKTEEGSSEKAAGPRGARVPGEPSESHAEQKAGQDPMVAISSGHGAHVEPVEDTTETREQYTRAGMKELSHHESEDSQEDMGKNDYDEDFEADEEVNEEGQTSDQMSGMSKSSTDDEKENLDHEKESRNSTQKAVQATDSEKDESDGRSDSTSDGSKQDRRSALCSSSMSTLYSSEDDSAENFKDNVKDNEECDTERPAGSIAHAGCGSENGKNDRSGIEDNPETFALEEEGIDDAEEREAARVNTDFFHESVMAIQYQGPKVSGQLEHAGSVESDTREDGEKAAHTGKEDVLVSLESRVMEVEDRSEESPQSDEGGDCKSAQEKITDAIEDDHHVTPELETSDSRADGKEENLTGTECALSEAPDGASLAEETRTLEIQKAEEQVVQEGQMMGEKQVLEKEDFVAEEVGARSEEVGQETALEGDLLSQEDTIAGMLVEAQLAVEKSAPKEERAMTEEDSKEEETGRGGEVPFGEQGVLKAAEALGGAMPEGAEVLQAVVWRGREVDGAGPKEHRAEQDAVQGASEAKEVLSESAAEAGEAAEEGGVAGKEVVEVAVAEGQEAVGDTKLAEELVGEVSPGAEEAGEEAASEGQEAVEKFGALLEASGEMDLCTEAAALGREELKKSSEFPLLEAAGEEGMEAGKAARGAAVSNVDEPSEIGESSLLRAGAEAEGSPWEAALGLEALGGAGGRPISRGSSQLREMAAEEEQEQEEGWAGAARGAPRSGAAALGCAAWVDMAPAEPGMGATGGPEEAAGAAEAAAEAVVPGGGSAVGLPGTQGAVGRMGGPEQGGLGGSLGLVAPEAAAALGVAATALPGGNGCSVTTAQATAAAGAGGIQGTEAAAAAGTGGIQGMEAAAGAGAGGTEGMEAAAAAGAGGIQGTEAAGGTEGMEAAAVAGAGGIQGTEAAAGAGARRPAGPSGLQWQEVPVGVAPGGHVEEQGTLPVGDKASAGTQPTVPGPQDRVVGPAAEPTEPALSPAAEEEAPETAAPERDPGGNEGLAEGETAEAEVGTEGKAPSTSEKAQGEGEAVAETARSILEPEEQLERQPGKEIPGPGHPREPPAPQGAAESRARMF